MKKKTGFGLLIIKAGFVLIFTLHCIIGCGAGGSDNSDAQDRSDGSAGKIGQSDKKSNVLVCEDMLSKDFASAHSLSIETYNMTGNPTKGAEDVATLCTIKRDGKRISDVSVANANKKTYDSLLAQLQSVNKMVEDHSVGSSSAYAEDYSVFVFLGTNNATTVSITNIVDRSLEETKAIAQEINSKLPDKKPLADTTPDLLCPDMLSPSDLATIFGREMVYESNTPTAYSNTLKCDFKAKDDAHLNEMINGSVEIYCDPPQNQITPQQSFKIRKNAVLNGGAEAPGGASIKFEDFQSLSGIGSEAYSYKVAFGKKMQSYSLIMLHESKNCCIELSAAGFSGQDFNPQLAAMAKKVDANILQ
jgi:hypothetical protein